MSVCCSVAGPMRKARSSAIGRDVVVIFVLAWSVLPLLFVVVSSFKPSQQIFDYPPTLIFAPTLEHYRDLLQKWPTFLQTLATA